MKTAFVFAGGGSLGAIQVGMLKALTENDLRPDLLVGSSVGAINAAYFAADPSAHGISRLEAIWLSLHRDDVFHFSWVSGIKGFLGKRTHLFDEKTFKRFLAERLMTRLHNLTGELIGTFILVFFRLWFGCSNGAVFSPHRTDADCRHLGPGRRPGDLRHAPPELRPS